MFRKFVEFLIGPSGPKNEPDGAAPAGWRQAPSRTTVDEIGGIKLTMTMSTGHHKFVSIVGESHYQDAIRAVSRRVGSEGVFTARLVLEPDNPYDPNAIAVCDDESLQKLGHLARGVAERYHSKISDFNEIVNCPARLTGGDHAFGIVLDFEDVRAKLGLPPVSVDMGDMDYDAVSEYHRINGANRKLVASTKPLEKSDPERAIAQYRQALAALSECRKLSETRGLVAYGFKPNQTDATPVERITMCLIRLQRPVEAQQVVEAFLTKFPHARDTTLIAETRDRIQRALSKTTGDEG